ncbi:unnamed protein product [Parnassius mnemosyne]|uniref:THAP-type domain-containing protein n=1 Tax=Parnassius mnemosyne TaxID=213953 RepID=A0AAV1LCE3_9NEOP
MVQSCVVNGCKSESYPGCGKSFHRFPNDEETRNKWIQALHITKKISKYSVVCSLHFKKEDFLPSLYKKLKSKVVPSIFSMVGMSSVTSMKSVQSIQSSSFNIAISSDGSLCILPSSGVPIIPQQPNHLETCLNMSQISNSGDNGPISSTEKRTMVLLKPNSKVPRLLEDDPLRSTTGGDVILIGDEEPEAHEQVVKYPIRIESKIDWEDKIPMDIISFVTATCDRNCNHR